MFLAVVPEKDTFGMSCGGTSGQMRKLYAEFKH
jgi:hypothetical protein